MSKTIRMAALAALLFTPAVVQAQEPLGGWQGLKLSSLETVYVTDDAGRRTEGKLLRFDADSLVMLVDGMEQRFDATHVLRVDKRGDSLKNGALIGAALGLLFGSISAGISDCPGEDPGGELHRVQGRDLRRRVGDLHSHRDRRRRDDRRTHSCVRRGPAGCGSQRPGRPAVGGARALVGRRQRSVRLQADVKTSG